MVGAVPKHGSGLGSARARQWSEQSPSMAVVWSIIELKICSEKKQKRTPLVLLFGVFIYLLTLSSPICHVWSKKQTDITYHSAFLLFLTNSRLAPVWRCVSVDPLTLLMKRRVHWKRRGAFVGVDLEVVKTTVCGACARLPRISGGRNDGALGYL